MVPNSPGLHIIYILKFKSLDFSDLNKDGETDFFVTDMMSQSHILQKTQMGTMAPTPLAIGEIDNRPQYMHNTLFLNRGDQTFSEISQYSNTQASEWSWGTIFIDVDLDGHEAVSYTHLTLPTKA